MALEITPTHLQSFSSWLRNQNYQSNTIRNYLLDITTFRQQSRGLLSPATVSQFISSITGQNNAPRHLASLSKFCQFASDQGLTSSNFYPAAKKSLSSNSKITLEKLLDEFNHYLFAHHKSPATVKNYLSDLRQFIDFCEHQQLQ